MEIKREVYIIDNHEYITEEMIFTTGDIEKISTTYVPVKIIQGGNYGPQTRNRTVKGKIGSP